MFRSTFVAIWATASMALAGCVGQDADPWGTGDLTEGDFALTNTTTANPEGLLRGQGLKIYTEIPSAQLVANTIYEVSVTNDNTGEELSRGELRTNASRGISPYTLMFDVGLFDAIEESQNLRVAVEGDDGTDFARIISLGVLRIPGWDVTETVPPQLYVCDSHGQPANAFAVGGQDPGEVAGEVYVCGRDFPEGVRGGTVDVYVVLAHDNWLGEDAPQEGQPDHVFGPVSVPVDATGQIRSAGTGFVPELGDVGIYDVLVDVDGDGAIRQTFAMKDGGDGIGEQVGFTVQYSQAWIRARGERHILVNMAFTSQSRDGGVFANEFAPTQTVYLYLNPPVMHQYHFAVTKYIVPHQGFDEFWNNPDMETGPGGCVPFEDLIAIGMSIPVQRGCTNSGPVDFGAPVLLDPEGAAVEGFDVVFDRDGDGCYMAGVDLLDVIGGALTDGGLVSYEQFSGLAREDQVGFRVSDL